MTIQVNALEARIIGILKDWYPITVEELRDELSLRRDTLDRALKSLIVKGVIVLEPLDDKIFVRLLMPDIEISVPGRKRKKPKSLPSRPLDDDLMMYR